MTKRLLAFALVFALLVPVFAMNKAEALSTPQYTAEPYNFTQSQSPTAFDPGSAATRHVPADLANYIHNFQSTGDDNASWTYAAVAALEATGYKNQHKVDYFIFDFFSIMQATSNKSVGAQGGFNRDITGPGNRSMLTAYLMRGTNGGPANNSELLKAKPMHPVSGIAYIPNLRATADNTARTIYENRIKHAVVDKGAVSASLYFDESRFYPDEDDTTIFIYDNVTRRVDGVTVVSALNKTADHTVTIVGWDDNFEATYMIDRIIGDTATTTSVSNADLPAGRKGAWLVYDYAALQGELYWISYDTPLTNAYYIEGFHDSEGDFPLVTQRKKDGVPIEKNPLGHTYEHDLFGMTGVRAIAASQTEAYYANVWDVTNDNAAAIHAVSLFLTGEKNDFTIYLVDNYKNNDDLKGLTLDPTLKDNDKATVVAQGKKDLPGYYTIPLNKTAGSPPIVEGRKFAIVAVVECDDNGGSKAAVPIQSTSLATVKSGQGFFSTNGGTTWTDAFTQGQSAICIKAHAERDIDIELDKVEIRDSDGKETATLELAPGASHPVGPSLVPANANDVIRSETVWQARVPYYERDKDGYLIADYDEDTKKWVAEMVEIPAGEWLTWNASWGMFIPDNDDFPKTKPSVITNAKLNRTLDEDGKEQVVSDYISEQAFLISNATSGAATLRVSGNQKYYENPADRFSLQVSVYTGEKDDAGEFEKTGAAYVKKSTITSLDVEINIVANEVVKLELNRNDHTMKAGATVSLTVKQLDKDDKNAPARAVTWYVLDDLFESGGKRRDYNPLNLYDATSSPVAVVDKSGKVTAIRDGVCYVYAEVGNVKEYCRINVTKTAATGITLNKKKMTMSVGTELSLLANVKPASASNKGVTWTFETDKPGIIELVGDNDQIIKAVGPGVIKVIATTSEDNGGYRAECVITVTEGPSSTIRKGKSVTYSALGASSKEMVDWSFLETDAEGELVLGGDGRPKIIEDAPGQPANKVGNTVTGTKSGLKYKVSAQNTGPAKLQAVVSVTVPVYDSVTNTESTQKIELRRQTWNLEAVIPISKMAMKNDKNEVIKKLTLCVSEDGTDGTGADPTTLSVQLIKPTDGTLLDFVWSHKLNKQKEPMLDITPDADKNGTVTITALKPGSTKLTGLNYNGNKKVSLSIKIMLYPTTDNISVKKDSFTLVVGKKASVKGKVTGKNINKELSYELAPGSEAFLTLEMKKGKPSGKVLAKAPGNATVFVIGTGNESAIPPVEPVRIPVTIEVIEKKSR